MTKKTQDTPALVEAAILRDCGFGAAGDVVSLPAEDAQAGADHGMLDLHPEAVAYAKSPKQ